MLAPASIVCQNDESDALMITSTFLPAAFPPLPPPLELDELPEARPPTTPTTSAISAMTATNDNENFRRTLLMEPDPLSSLTDPTPGAPQIRENVYNETSTVDMGIGLVKRERLLDSCVYTSNRR